MTVSEPQTNIGTFQRKLNPDELTFSTREWGKPISYRNRLVSVVACTHQYVAGFHSYPCIVNEQCVFWQQRSVPAIWELENSLTLHSGHSIPTLAV